MVKVMEKPKKKKNILLRLTLVIFLAYVSVVFVNQQVSIAQKKAEYDRLSAQLSDQKAQNAEFKELSGSGNLAAYYELIARGLSYAYPGELVFVDISGN